MNQALVSLENGIPSTTSLKVSEVFHKRHTEVLRGIRLLCDNTPESFYGRNFASVEYTDAKGERRPMYTMTRDGFTLLVMGYTGKDAMRFKLEYIEAFNAMEKELSVRPSKGEHQVNIANTSVLSTIESRKPLRALVGTWAQASGQTFAACWNQLKAAFQLANIKDLPEAWVPDTIAWVQDRLDATPKTLPEPDPQDEYADCLVKLDNLCDRVRMKCHPGAKTTFMTEPERDMYAMRYEMYCAVTDCLLAAHRMMNVGRRLNMKRNLIS